MKCSPAQLVRRYMPMRMAKKRIASPITRQRQMARRGGGQRHSGARGSLPRKPRPQNAQAQDRPFAGLGGRDSPAHSLHADADIIAYDADEKKNGNECKQITITSRRRHAANTAQRGSSRRGMKRQLKEPRLSRQADAARARARKMPPAAEAEESMAPPFPRRRHERPQPSCRHAKEPTSLGLPPSAKGAPRKSRPRPP